MRRCLSISRPQKADLKKPTSKSRPQKADLKKPNSNKPTSKSRPHWKDQIKIIVSKVIEDQIMITHF
jgi:hypothetical protein